jgi:glyoxylase-like metal-dependent hydrolase (beta-lactamase superfamily II)
VSGARIALGDFEIQHIQAAVYRWDGGTFFGVVPKTMWSRKLTADELNRIPVAMNCYIIRTGEQTILVETGAGDKLDQKARERADLSARVEQMPEVLARHGVDPEEIDIVIDSHLHWDHCGGNTILKNGGAVPAFPRARYFASRPEWEHAHERHIRDSVSYNDLNYDPLVDTGQMVLVDGAHEVAPGIRMRPAPGHNRDMCVVTAVSQGRTFCFFSDLIPTLAHVQPTWVTAFDLFPLQTIDTKLQWLETAARKEWICGFGHDAYTGFARIATDPKTRFTGHPIEIPPLPASH